MIRESVRYCPREAGVCGPAFPRDLHAVTAVTLSVLRAGPIASAFPGLEIRDFLQVLGLRFRPRAPRPCGDIGSAAQESGKCYLGGEGGKGKGAAPSL